jgi:integrase
LLSRSFAIHPSCWHRALVLVLAYGGLRIGEAAALTPARVDIEKRQIHIVQTVSWVKGHLHLHEPKTASGRRKVGLPQFVADELAEHMARYGSADLVFPAPEGGHLQPTAFRARQFAPAAETARLKGLRIHDLRHTAVSLWIASGADVKRIAARAGHSTTSFTLDRYGHLLPDAEDDLMDALDVLGRAAQPGGNVVSLRAQAR